MGQQPVGHLTGDLGHQRTHRRQEDGRVAERVGARVEHRGHEGVTVVLPPEAETAAVGPAGPDGAHGQDELAHPRGRVRPGHRIALLDMGFDLAPEAQHEPALGQGLQVVGRHRQGHRVAGEGHGDPGADLEMLGVLGGEHQWQERVVAGLGRPDAVIAGSFGHCGLGDHPGRVEWEGPVDEHGPR